MLPPSRHGAPGDLEQALFELGIDIWRTTDDEVTSLCPGHMKRTGRPDRNPTWSVNRTTGLHNCFSCGFKGTFIELVMELMFPNDVFRAARWLRQFGANLARAQDLVSFDEKHSEVEVEHQLVPETRLAMYDEVPDWALEARNLTRESVDHYGVRWNTKRESWIIPVRRPETAELVGWQEKWQNKRRFINSPEDMVKSECLFGFDVFPVGEPAVLMESPLDVCRLYSAGWEGGLSSYGAAVSARQCRLIVDVTEELVVALDDDDDGNLHAEELRSGKWERGKLVTPALAGRLNLRFLAYPRSFDGKDIGTMTDSEIERAIYEANHSTVAKLVSSEQGKKLRVHRGTAGLPSRAGRANGRPRSVPSVGRSRMPDGGHRGRRQPPGQGLPPTPRRAR